MPEHNLDEAQTLLETNVSIATKNLDSLEKDLEFLQDQFTATEVSMARVHHWDVERRNKDDSTKNKGQCPQKFDLFSKHVALTVSTFTPKD